MVRADEGEGAPKLTPREREVLRLLMRGLLDKEATDRLGVSVGTVRVYRKRIMGKLGTRGLVRSALVAWRLGQLDMEALADEVMAERGAAGPVPRHRLPA